MRARESLGMVSSFCSMLALGRKNNSTPTLWGYRLLHIHLLFLRCIGFGVHFPKRATDASGTLAFAGKHSQHERLT